MAVSRYLLAVAGLLFCAPTFLFAQDVSSMVARVEADGNPVSGVRFAVISGGTQRPLATTGSTGLAVIEFDRVPLDSGTRLAAFVVSCGEHHEVLFARGASDLPLTEDGCERSQVGTVVWGRADRVHVVLGETPRLSSRAAKAVIRAVYGFRAQVGPAVSFVGGDELDNVGTGFGGDLLVGYDFPEGFGIGLGVGLARHDLQGSSSVDEGLWRWAVMAEPRYTFGRAQSHARPYVAARAGWQSLDADDGAGLTTETGWSLGLGGGVVVPVVRGAARDIAVHASRLSLGADLSGTSFDRSGMLFSVGAALRY